MKVYDLIPIDNRKSFYNKAIVVIVVLCQDLVQVKMRFSSS